MSLDETLLESAAGRGAATVRIYSWSHRTISLGRHQRVEGRIDREAVRALGLGIVRRITGGRALVHHREITYAVTAAVGTGTRLRDDYARINALLLATLHALGVPAREALDVPAPRAPGHAPCFEAPAKGELMIDAGKLVGSAQLRLGGALLQHGSILVDDDQGLLSQVTLGGAPLRPAATLRAALGREVGAAEFAEVLLAQMRRLWDAEAAPGALTPAEARRAGELRSRYEDSSWTWRGTH
jgi:lipoate-protein ligase A